MTKKYKPYPKSKTITFEEIMGNLSLNPEEYWGTMTGQFVHISNLRDSHIERIIEHCKNTGRAYLVPKFKEEQKRRKKAKLAKKTKMGKVLYGR